MLYVDRIVVFLQKIFHFPFNFIFCIYKNFKELQHMIFFFEFLIMRIMKEKKSRQFKK